MSHTTTVPAWVAAQFAKCGKPLPAELRVSTSAQTLHEVSPAPEHGMQVHGGVLTLTLPYPPTVNRHLIPVSGRLVKSPQHREYAATCGKMIQVYRRGQPPLTCDLIVTIELHPPDRRKRDADNPIKAALDALKAGGVYLDDSQVKEPRPIMSTPASPAYITVIIEERTSTCQ